MGVVTGIPMEFQFGTNWARFSRFAGGVIGQTLAMEGLFAFFLESSVPRPAGLGRAPGSARRGHFRRRAGAARRQLAVGLLHRRAPTRSCSIRSGTRSRDDGSLQLASFWGFLLNPWALAEYAHTMMAAVVTASFVVAAVGRLLRAARAMHAEPRARFLARGHDAPGSSSSLLVAFPTGDAQAKLVARHQPVALAAMEGRFESGRDGRASS